MLIVLIKYVKYIVYLYIKPGMNSEFYQMHFQHLLR